MALDAAEFAQESSRVGKKTRCEVGRVLKTLSTADRRVLEGILASDPLDVSAGAVANVLRRHGHETVTHNWVRTHRAKSCACFKTP